MAAVRIEDRSRYGSRDALLQSTATVGVIEATTGDVFVQRSFPNARRVALVIASDGALALRNRTIDVFVHDGPSIAWLVSANEADLAGIWEPLNRENLAWAVRRDDAQLLAQINDILGGWKRDGTLSGVLVRWLPYLEAPELRRPLHPGSRSVFQRASARSSVAGPPSSAPSVWLRWSDLRGREWVLIGLVTR